jgi:hypothetical protein
MQRTESGDSTTVAFLDSLRTVALAGIDFGVLAKKFSEDKETNLIGGMLGTLDMEQLDKSWEEGAVPFTRAFYYFVVPRSLGGDRDKAAGAFARAVELGPNRLVIRWGRARFFDVLTKNREGFVDDLQWVAARDPETCSDAPAWKAYVQRDAKQLLQKVDHLF